MNENLKKILTMKTNLLLFIFLLFGLNVFSQTILLQEYFDDVNNFPPNWSNIDKDGDGNKWKLRKNSAGDTYTYSESWANDVVLFPNNYLITPQIDLTGLTGTVALSYLVGAADPEFFADHYKVALSTTSAEPEAFTNTLFEETTTVEAYDGWPLRNIDISSFKGQKVYLAWVHYDCSDEYRLLIDSIVVKNTPTSGLAVNNEVEVSLFPNPVKDKLFVTGNFENSVMELISSDGRIVYKSGKVSRDTYVDVNRFERGFYILRIETPENTILRKVNILE